MPNFIAEISFKTSRSGGKGGQNVNKVESRVEAIWDFESSSLLSEEEKMVIRKKLKNRLNHKGHLSVTTDSKRSQLENKEVAVKLLHQLVKKSLEKQKLRIATKPTTASKKKHREQKAFKSEIKQLRKKIVF